MDTGSSEQYKFELYDLNTGEIKSTKTVYFSTGDEKVVFDKVSPSTYAIYFSSTSCDKKKALPGQGIILE
jgi:hypothetical protein